MEMKEGDDKIRVPEDSLAANLDGIDKRVFESEEFDEGIETKTMKEHIDLECQSKMNRGKDLKDIGGSFWGAASKKLRKWSETQKLKKESRNLVGVEVGKHCQRRYRETQSEIGTHPRMNLDDSHLICDTDPRMSVDAGRVSYECVRFSLDDPSVSWDGYVIEREPLVSVVEDNNVPVAAGGFDEEVLDKEKIKYVNDENKPRGSAPTRDNYSPHMRMKSFEVKSDTIGLLNGEKLVITEKELTESDWNQPNVRSHRSESSVPARILGQKGLKKLRGWHKAWHIWGSIPKQKQCENECKDEDKYMGGNVIDRPLANGDATQKLIRSYSVR